MTAPHPAACGRSGHTATTQAFLLSLLNRHDHARCRRIEALVAELDDIQLDRAYAAQMRPETTSTWLRDLVTEERGVWRELRATTSSASAP